MAKSVPGYIITHSNDTVYGSVKAVWTNLNNSAFVISGIDLESYYHSVRFKEYNTKSFKTYTSDDIAGFAFTRKSIEYHFDGFKLEFKGVTYKEKERQRFLNLIYSSEIKLYRNVDRKPQLTTEYKNYEMGLVYYEYFLYCPENGLVKVEESKEFKSLSELLRHYGVDERFLQKLPDNIKFKYVKDVLLEYEKWKHNNYSIT